jgi:hypothetical protein
VLEDPPRLAAFVLLFLPGASGVDLLGAKVAAIEGGLQHGLLSRSLGVS